MLEQPRTVREKLNCDESTSFALSRSFYTSCGKRVVDVLASALGIFVLSPALIIVACAIKLTSPGPAFYRQVRIGKQGRPFQILKFRSMVVDLTCSGLGITASGDSRVTRIGKFLRQYKIDEVPQLWNVLLGEMSLVGPRPELPAYVALYTREQRQVLSAKPGITDPASLAYRHEEKILAEHGNPECFYQMTILPDKLARNIAYLQQVSFTTDICVIVETLASVFLPSRSKQA